MKKITLVLTLVLLSLFLWENLVGANAQNIVPTIASDKTIFTDNSGRELARLTLHKNFVDSNGQEFIALDMRLAKGWKTYSNAPDAGGLPPDIDHHQSHNLQSWRLLFPPDESFTYAGIKSRGYKDRVVFPVAIDRQQPAQPLVLNLRARFLICDVICIPASFSINERLAPLTANQANNPIIATALASIRADQLAINKLSDANNGTQVIGVKNKPTNNGATLSAPSLLRYLLLALLGGLLLNLMPCMLPALSLKLHSLRQLGDKDKQRLGLQQSIFFTALGLWAFFLLLGLLFYFLRSFTDRYIFWGIYFQSPIFLAIILVIFLFIFISALGFFEIRHPLQLSLLSPRLRTRLHQSSLFSGKLSDLAFGFVMAMLSASCLAPLLGTSLTFVLTQPQPLLIPLFLTTIGFGLVMPWFLLLLFPSMRLFTLPASMRHGALIALNIFTSILLLIIIIWLTGLLAAQWGPAVYVLLALLTILFIRPKKSFSLANIFFLLWSIGIMLAPLLPPTQRTPTNWQMISSAPQAPTKPTILVVTADWCITCQVNKKIVFESNAFQSWAKANNVQLLMADWTKPNQDIANLVSGAGRVGIPLTIFYNGQGNSVILPELLSMQDFKYLIIK